MHDTPALATFEELEAAASDAYTAHLLERRAAQASDEAEATAKLETYARDRIARLFGEGLADLAVIETDGDTANIKIASLHLRTQTNSYLAAVVTCPLCDAWNVLTRDELYDLADVGAVLCNKAELYWHDTPDRDATCDGHNKQPKPVERETYRHDIANDAGQLCDVLNAAVADGYKPMILPAERGWIIVGRRIGDRWNKNYDAIDDEEPF